MGSFTSARITRSLAGLLLVLSILLLISLHPSRSDARTAASAPPPMGTQSGYGGVSPRPEVPVRIRHLSTVSSADTVSLLAWGIVGSEEDTTDSRFLDLARLEVWEEPGESLVSFEVSFFYPFAGIDLWPTGESAADVLVDTDSLASTGERVGGFLGSDVCVAFRYLGGGEYEANVYRTPSGDTASWVLLGQFEAYMVAANQDEYVLGVSIPAGLLGSSKDMRAMAWSQWVSPIAEEYEDWLPDSTYAEFHLGPWDGGTTTTAPATTTTTTVQRPPAAFTDVPPSHPNAPAISDLASRGIINGYDDGTFRPGTPVRRQQFAKMIILSLGLEPIRGGLSSFGDVEDSYPYPAGYVAAAARLGITVGTSPGKFSPYAEISRAQVVTMVARAVHGLDPGLLLTPPAVYRNAWGTSFSVTHGPNARIAEYNGLLDGLPLSVLSPWGDMSRGETAQVLHNFLVLWKEGPAASSADNSALVTRITDGDSIEVSYKGARERIRLVGIDGPEYGEAFAAEATAALRALIGGKTVDLEFDIKTRDQYGRLLAYVWVGSTMANAEMLREGLATVYTVQPNTKYLSTLKAAENEAKAAQRGIWAEISGSPLEIVDINANAVGNVNCNLNGEYVLFKVLEAGSLAGYSVEDESGHRYGFPTRVFQAGQAFKLRTGAGTDTQTDLYWGMIESAVWNNAGDTVKLLDSQGHVVLSQSY